MSLKCCWKSAAEDQFASISLHTKAYQSRAKARRKTHLSGVAAKTPRKRARNRKRNMTYTSSLSANRSFCPQSSGPSHGFELHAAAWPGVGRTCSGLSCEQSRARRGKNQEKGKRQSGRANAQRIICVFDSSLHAQTLRHSR